MNSSYYQNQINRLEKDIADLQKKIADENKKEIDKNKQIDSVHRTIKILLFLLLTQSNGK